MFTLSNVAAVSSASSWLLGAQLLFYISNPFITSSNHSSPRSAATQKLLLCELSNDSEKIWPQGETLPKYVRLQNFFQILGNLFTYFLRKLVSCSVPYHCIGEKYWLVFGSAGSIFFRKRENDCFVFPTSTECSFREEKEIYFRMKSIRQERAWPRVSTLIIYLC